MKKKLTKKQIEEISNEWKEAERKDGVINLSDSGKILKNTCNQCHKEMNEVMIITYDKFNGEATGHCYLYVCRNFTCPNYGLMQISEETMHEIYKQENK